MPNATWQGLSIADGTHEVNYKGENMSITSKQSSKIGCEYVTTTKAGKKKHNILLNADRLRELLDTNVVNGNLRLTALENDFKEKTTQPDMNILDPISTDESSGGAGGGRGVGKQGQGVANAGAKRSPFPYQ